MGGGKARAKIVVVVRSVCMRDRKANAKNVVVVRSVCIRDRKARAKIVVGSGLRNVTCLTMSVKREQRRKRKRPRKLLLQRFDLALTGI